ncbi:MAG: isoamylase [Cyanobacteria bacterium REEB67]|nr:isoamylase [Cyanobacteria bacterium REEB67]
MASGGLINAGLPVAHSGITRGLKLFGGEARTANSSSISAKPEPLSLKPNPEPLQFRALTSHSEPLKDLVKGLADQSRIARIAEVEKPEQGGTVIPFDKAAFGLPEPLGATLTDTGVNFAVASKGATKMEVHIFADAKAGEPTQVLPMYKSGDVWHRNVDGLKAGSLYLYSAEGAYTPQADGSRFNYRKLLIDPYAKALTDDKIPLDNSSLGYDNSNPSDADRHLRPSTVDSTAEMPKGVVVDPKAFDWQGVEKPHIPETDEVAYEAHLRGFTAGDASLGSAAGTFRGFISKIPFIKGMGYTTVELMPIMQSDRSPWFGKSPVTGEPLLDSWAYNTVAYQAPDAGLAHDGKMGEQVNEFKEMVRELHRNNIEVLLDIVFNHTRESNQYGPTISFRGLDNNVYYMTVPGHPDVYVDHTGCGNTVNTNDPQAQKLIMDTLRYWVQEMQVDGFRFDLASVFKYDVDGQAKYKPPIIAAMEDDPVLSQAKVKLVSEPWATDRYDFGNFSDKRWAELNGPFRDTVRSFVKSDGGKVSAMATQIAGTPELFDRSKGRFPINMVTNHDGFTINDVVSYNEKHNEANGENNRDGNSDNHSWNGGVEGPLEKAALSDDQKASIEALRTRQIKNMFSMLFLSRGVPMVLYGDEMRRTTGGNNNTWNQDKLNTLDWSLLDKNQDMVRFVKMMIELRKNHEIGRSAPEAISWHGVEPFKPDWSPQSHFIAWQLAPTSPTVKPLFSAFNAYWEPLTVKLPPGSWHRLVDTNLPTGQDIVTPDQATPLSDTYVVQPRSGIVLEGRAQQESGQQ